MIATEGTDFDIILISGEPYTDHPLSAVGAIARVLEAKGYKVGGIEASLRRFAYYDYWDDKVRRSLLLDSRVDILVYGPGELQAIEIARRVERGEDLLGIPGTCVVRREVSPGFTLLPSSEEVSQAPEKFSEAQRLKCYFMVAHPGTSAKEARELAQYLRKLEKEGEKPVEGVQIFTPTPMTRSTCMYYTGMDPLTGEPVYVPRSFAEKKEQKRLLT